MSNADLDKKIKSLVYSNCYEKGYVCAVDVLIQLAYLSMKDYEDWRFGRVEYLERVCNIGLSKLSLIQKLIRKYSTDLDLKNSWTAYNQFGKGRKCRLRFSKSGHSTIEERYATHYIDVKRMSELKEKVSSLEQEV
jgi:hypothetical protein